MEFSKKQVKNELFHDTKTFLQNYRSLKLSSKYAREMQRKRMAENDTSLEWEVRDDELEFNNMILEEAYAALDYLKQIPKKGVLWYYLLRVKYFNTQMTNLSDDKIIEALQDARILENVSKTTFYRYQKEAIHSYGNILWGSLNKDSSVYRRFEKMIHEYN